MIIEREIAIMTIKKLVGRGIWTNRKHIRAVYINYELVSVNLTDRWCLNIENYNSVPIWYTLSVVKEVRKQITRR